MAKKPIKKTSRKTDNKGGQSYNAVFDVLSKVKSAIIEPNKFFSQVKSEKELYKPLLYFILINVLLLGLWRVDYIFLKFSFKYPVLNGILGANPIIKMWLLWIPMRIAGIFALAWLLNTCVKLFTVKRHSYIDAMKVTVYGETPYALFGWISPVLFSVWSAVLYIKGLNKIYGISTIQSIFSLLLAVLLAVVIVFIVTALAAAMFISI